MRKITIVGGGQAGMQLAIGLRQRKYEVRVVSNRTPEDIRSGKVLSSQCMFDDALQSERDLGINFWERDCPNVDGIGVILPAPDGSGTGWTNALLMPPPPHVVNILVAAQKSAKIGRAFVNGFDDPRTFFPWLADPAEAEKFIAASA